MSLTDTITAPPEAVSPDDLALSLFDEVVVPLARSLRASGRPEAFARSGDPALSSYYEAPTLSVMRPADFDFPGGGDAIGLIDELGRYWRDRGDEPYAVLLPRLKEIAEILRKEAAESSGEVDILCYTMF
jgi:hypothetical protein